MEGKRAVKRKIAYYNSHKGEGGGLEKEPTIKLKIAARARCGRKEKEPKFEMWGGGEWKVRLFSSPPPFLKHRVLCLFYVLLWLNA